MFTEYKYYAYLGVDKFSNYFSQIFFKQLIVQNCFSRTGMHEHFTEGSE